MNHIKAFGELKKTDIDDVIYHIAGLNSKTCKCGGVNCKTETAEISAERCGLFEHSFAKKNS